MTNFRTKVLALLTLALPFAVFPQYNMEYGGGVGVSNYLGDIGGKENTRKDFVSDMKMAETRFDLSAFYRYRFRREVYFKGALTYIRLAGDDRLTTNIGRHYRNFNFVNNVFELAATAEYMFYENTDLGASYRFRNALRFYAFSGVGLIYHSPRTKLEDGEKVTLRPLMTEGQANPYKRFVLCIPTGVGMHYTMKKRHRFGWEINWRTVFSDYLDDIKGNYPDPSAVDAETSAAVFRSDETDISTEYPGLISAYDGQYWDSDKDGVADSPDKRGDATHNDSYITIQFNYSYVIRGKSSFYRSRYGNFFKKNRRKGSKRIRSKF
jgi:hypothetical protein